MYLEPVNVQYACSKEERGICKLLHQRGSLHLHISFEKVLALHHQMMVMLTPSKPLLNAASNTTKMSYQGTCFAHNEVTADTNGKPVITAAGVSLTRKSNAYRHSTTT